MNNDSTQTACTSTDRTPIDYKQLATHTIYLTLTDFNQTDCILNFLHKAEHTAHDVIQPTSHQTTSQVHCYAQPIQWWALRRDIWDFCDISPFGVTFAWVALLPCHGVVQGQYNALRRIGYRWLPGWWLGRGWGFLAPFEETSWQQSIHSSERIGC